MANEEVSIQVSEHGPYLVRGPVKILDAEGNEFETPRKNVALCRCGRSENKPYCDGTHVAQDFQSRVLATTAPDGVPNANRQIVDTPQEASERQRDGDGQEDAGESRRRSA